MRSALLLSFAASCEGLLPSSTCHRRLSPQCLSSTASYADSDFGYSAADNAAAAAASKAIALAAIEAADKAKGDFRILAAGLLTGSEPAPLEIPASRANSWKPLNSFQYKSVKEKVVAEHRRLVALGASRQDGGSEERTESGDETPGPLLAPLFQFDAEHREKTLQR